jgi:DNA mismatch endonuclease (patch repair protein)
MNADDKPVRRHRGDIMSVEKRSAVMSRIRGTGTKPELALEAALTQLGLHLERHPRDVAGRPDFVHRETEHAIFVDGDFWHGYRFADWRLKLSEKWEAKIAETRRRDRRVNKELRAAGWTVMRFWEHDVERDAGRCASRIHRAVKHKLQNQGLDPGGSCKNG